MSSPVGHTLFGLSIYVVWCRNLCLWFRQLPLIIWVIICANLPDFDLFIGLAKGDLSRYHQTYTHTLGFAVLTGLIMFLALKIIKSKNAVSVSVLSFLIVFSHVLLDLFNYDSRQPIGVMLFWPFSNRYISLIPIFYAVPHSKLNDIFSSPFVNAMVREVIILFMPLLVLIYFRWKKDYGKG